jgi:acyl-CoA hydrolase
MRHLDYRVTLGHPPVTGAPTPTIGGWFRLRDPGPVTPDPLAAILVDAWPPPALSMLRRPRPASTVSWHLAPTPTMARAEADAWHLIRTDAPHAGEGFAPVRAELWDDAGQLLAISQQVDVVFG